MWEKIKKTQTGRPGNMSAQLCQGNTSGRPHQNPFGRALTPTAFPPVHQKLHKILMNTSRTSGTDSATKIYTHTHTNTHTPQQGSISRRAWGTPLAVWQEHPGPMTAVISCLPLPSVLCPGSKSPTGIHPQWPASRDRKGTGGGGGTHDLRTPQ